MSDSIQYLPPYSTFYPQTMDIYAGAGGFPPPVGQLRRAGVAMQVTGTFPEGHRTKVAGTDTYTHIIVCDTNIEVHDPYTGVGNVLGTPDYVTIPGGTNDGTTNWWKVIYTFITTFPDAGVRRIIMIDRWGNPGTWPNIS